MTKTFYTMTKAFYTMTKTFYTMNIIFYVCQEHIMNVLNILCMFRTFYVSLEYFMYIIDIKGHLIYFM